MKITFLVITYNRPRLLIDSLRSLAQQDDGRWEALIVDDNSSDPYTEPLCRDFISQFPGAYVKSDISEEDRPRFVRYSVAINAVAPMATGDLLCYLSDDTELARMDTVSTVLGYFEQHSQRRAGYVGEEMVLANFWTGEMSKQYRTRRAYPGVGQPLNHPFAMLSGSQVFHYKEDFRDWPIDPVHWKGADAAFLEGLAKRVGWIYPIGNPLTETFIWNKLTDLSVTTFKLEDSLRQLREVGQLYASGRGGSNIPNG